MRFIQTFLPALREAPGQGARIVYTGAHYAPTHSKLRGTDLTCLPLSNNLSTYLPTNLTRLEHSQAADLFISRLQAHTSKLQLYPPRGAHRANLERRWPVHHTRLRGASVWEKLLQPTRDGSVSLTAAVRAAQGCRGPPEQARASALRAQRLHRWRFPPRCTLEQSMLWKPWGRRFDWSSLPSRSRFRSSTPVSCARKSLTSSAPRTLTRSQAVRVRSV